MRHFCTYFDSAYIWKGLALYESMKQVAQDFCLHVMALDEKSFAFLKKYECESLTIDNLKHIETDELLRLKATRTRAEYCWTCGPIIILHLIENYQLTDITYLDSDLMFFSSYEPLYEEIGNASVAITPQYSNHDEQVGKYCVQFMFFRNDKDGINCLTWWRDRCIEWCYARYEDGKYGDQKYLDSFPLLFNNIAIISHRGAGIANWNMGLYQYVEGEAVFEGKHYPIIFFHFHGLRMTQEDNTLVFQLFDCDYNKLYNQLFFQPYMQLIADNLLKYFNIRIEYFEVRKKSFVSEIYTYIKSKLRNFSIIQKIYFRFHKHESWEKPKL